MLQIYCKYCIRGRSALKESGMIQRLKIGTRDQGVLVPFPAQAVIYDFVLMCLSP